MMTIIKLILEKRLSYFFHYCTCWHYHHVLCLHLCLITYQLPKNKHRDNITRQSSIVCKTDDILARICFCKLLIISSNIALLVGQNNAWMMIIMTGKIKRTTSRKKTIYMFYFSLVVIKQPNYRSDTGTGRRHNFKLFHQCSC
jgi:hypothetical protein